MSLRSRGGFGAGQADVACPFESRHTISKLKRTSRFRVDILFSLAEREGFEPSMELPPYPLSKRAH